MKLTDSTISEIKFILFLAVSYGLIVFLAITHLRKDPVVSDPVYVEEPAVNIHLEDENMPANETSPLGWTKTRIYVYEDSNFNGQYDPNIEKLNYIGDIDTIYSDQ